jgi:hypothetical protein
MENGVHRMMFLASGESRFLGFASLLLHGHGAEVVF